MRFGDSFSLISHIINFIVFVYFAIILIKINMLDVIGLSISAFAIIMSLLSNIISVLERNR